MKIKKIKVQNFRLLKNFEIDLEDELSLVIGKNNTGKTSLLTVLNKFLNTGSSSFSFDDFNIDLKGELKKLISESISDEYNSLGITLKLFIEYNKSDYLANVSQVMMDLDPQNNYIVLAFEYLMNVDKLKLLKKDFDEFSIKEQNKKAEKTEKKEEYEVKDLFFYLRRNHSKYFDLSTKSVLYDIVEKKEDDSKFIDLKDFKNVIKNIINFKYISAKREVV